MIVIDYNSTVWRKTGAPETGISQDIANAKEKVVSGRLRRPYPGTIE
jgi:hypothetical protein